MTAPARPAPPAASRDIDLPVPFNNALANWLHRANPSIDTGIIYEICRYMHSKYPQFNEKSKLEFTTDRLVKRHYLHADYGEMLYKSTKAPAPGFRNKLRRLIRRLTPDSYRIALRQRFPELANRYHPDGYTYGSVALPDATFTLTVQMERIGYHQEVDHYMMLRPNYDEPRFYGSFEFIAGYEPLTDTLYLSEKVFIYER